MEIAELNIDPLFHARARFLVMLLILQKRECSFLQLAEGIGLTRGNLSIQVRKLQKAGCIEIAKEIKNNYSHTLCKITPAGTSAFLAYCTMLEKAISLCRQRLPHSEEYIEVMEDDEYIRLAVASIRYIESWGNYVRLFAAERMILAKSTTIRMENVLPVSLFMRVHRSYIINRAMIRQVNGNNILIDDTRIPIGKTYKRYVLEFCNGKITDQPGR